VKYDASRILDYDVPCPRDAVSKIGIFAAAEPGPGTEVLIKDPDPLEDRAPDDHIRPSA
jgi:hypothetical protein